MSKLLVIMANEPRCYREIISATLRALKPNIEVVDVEPEALEREVERLAPQLVVCSRLSPCVESTTLAWMELYPEQDNLARVSIDGNRSTVNGVQLVDLLSVIDRTEELVKAGQNGSQRSSFQRQVARDRSMRDDDSVP